MNYCKKATFDTSVSKKMKELKEKSNITDLQRCFLNKPKAEKAYIILNLYKMNDFKKQHKEVMRFINYLPYECQRLFFENYSGYGKDELKRALLISVTPLFQQLTPYQKPDLSKTLKALKRYARLKRH